MIEPVDPIKQAGPFAVRRVRNVRIGRVVSRNIPTILRDFANQVSGAAQVFPVLLAGLRSRQSAGHTNYSDSAHEQPLPRIDYSDLSNQRRFDGRPAVRGRDSIGTADERDDAVHRKGESSPVRRSEIQQTDAGLLTHPPNSGLLRLIDALIDRRAEVDRARRAKSTSMPSHPIWLSLNPPKYSAEPCLPE